MKTDHSVFARWPSEFSPWPAEVAKGLLFASIAVAILCCFFGRIHAEPQRTATAPRPVVCPDPGLTLDGRVVRVIDGDTIVVESKIEYHVRLVDCWAPESRTTNAQEKTRGLKSKTRMTELTDGQTVRVSIPAARDLTEMTTMGRVLGRAWVLNGDRPAKTDLSSIMVSEGLALPKKEDPTP